MNVLVMGLVVSKDLTSNFVLKPIEVNSCTGVWQQSGNSKNKKKSSERAILE